MNTATDLPLSEVISDIRQQGHPKSAVQRDFATTRAYQVGFTHGAEAVLDVLAYAGLIDDHFYLLDLDVHDDDRVARLLVDSWKRIVENDWDAIP